MARVDSILGIVVSQGANELRMGTGREPRMLRFGTPKRLSIPETSQDMLRHLLGEILTPEREQEMRKGVKVECTYESQHGAFVVALTGRGEADFDVVFMRSTARSMPGMPAPASAPASTPAPASASASEPAPAIEVAPEPAYASASEVAPAAGVTRELASMLARAADMGASDLHLASGAEPVVRVDGKLRGIGGEDAIDVERVLGQELAGNAARALAEGRSYDTAFELAGVGRFRLNVYRASRGTAAAIRLLARSAPRLKSLELPVPLDDLADLPHGLVVVCGPTGSGKSTTLAALAQEALRRRSVVLVTLEDPIEYLMEEPDGARRTASAIVRQRQVGRDVRDFATGLRDALREDPDVILVGEMRDPESISLALTAAETGHLVLTTLHSRSAASAIERVVDSYPPERQRQILVQLADSLRAVVAQRLLPRAMGSGRVAALEVLRVTHGVAAMIREGKTAQIPSAVQSGKREGMIALERCLADLVNRGAVRAEDARAVANEPGSLGAYLAG